MSEIIIPFVIAIFVTALIGYLLNVLIPKEWKKRKLIIAIISLIIFTIIAATAFGLTKGFNQAM